MFETPVSEDGQYIAVCFAPYDLVAGLQPGVYGRKNHIKGGKILPFTRKWKRRNFIERMVDNLFTTIIRDVVYKGTTFQCAGEYHRTEVTVGVRKIQHEPAFIAEIHKSRLARRGFPTLDDYDSAPTVYIAAKHRKHLYCRANFMHQQVYRRMYQNYLDNPDFYDPRPPVTLLDYLPQVYREWPDVLPEVIDEICVTAVQTFCVLCVNHHDMRISVESMKNLYITSKPYYKEDELELLYKRRLHNQRHWVRTKRKVMKTKWNGYYYVPINALDFAHLQDHGNIVNRVAFKWLEDAVLDMREHVVAFYYPLERAGASIFIEDYTPEGWDHIYYRRYGEYISVRTGKRCPYMHGRNEADECFIKRTRNKAWKEPEDDWGGAERLKDLKN